jgi:predicted ATPase
VRGIELRWDTVESPGSFPFSIPAIRSLSKLEFTAPVTFLVGDNGTGKSTLIEALAIALGFNAEGGTRNFRFATRPSESALHQHLVVNRRVGSAPPGFFLRAESLFNVATEVDALDLHHDFPHLYGDTSLHEQSHGESFLAIANHQFRRGGVYLLDEPEAALSLRGQLALLRRMYEVAEADAQFVVATHSPILLALPGAEILQLDDAGITSVSYDEADNVLLTRSFLEAPDQFLRHLLANDDPT